MLNRNNSNAALGPRSERSRTGSGHDHQEVDLKLTRPNFLDRFGDGVVATEDVGGDVAIQRNPLVQFGEGFDQPTDQQEHTAKDRKDQLRLRPEDAAVGMVVSGMIVIVLVPFVVMPMAFMLVVFVQVRR